MTTSSGLQYPPIEKTDNGYRMVETVEHDDPTLDLMKLLITAKQAGQSDFRPMSYIPYDYDWSAKRDQNTLLYRLNRRYVDKQDPGPPVPGDYRKG